MSQNYQNPFLILYLKASVEFDVKAKKNANKIIIDDVVEYVKNKKALYTSGDVTKTAFTFSDYVRKAWSNKKFDFDVEFLDMLCQCVSFFGKYNSWNEFVEVNGKNPYAAEAEALRSIAFCDLPIPVYMDIEHNVARTLKILRNTVYETESSDLKIKYIFLTEFERERQDIKSYWAHTNTEKLSNFKPYLIGLNKLKNNGTN